MNKEIIELMESEITTLIKELSMHHPGSKEYDDIAKAIDTLYATLNKEKTLMLEEVKIEKDLELQRNINKGDKILSAIKCGIDVAGIVLPLAFYGVWMNRGLEFEKEGSFTSATFKGILGKFKPSK